MGNRGLPKVVYFLGTISDFSGSTNLSSCGARKSHVYIAYKLTIYNQMHETANILLRVDYHFSGKGHTDRPEGGSFTSR
jgi:hypothetical protein